MTGHASKALYHANQQNIIVHLLTWKSLLKSRYIFFDRKLSFPESAGIGLSWREKFSFLWIGIRAIRDYNGDTSKL